MRTGAVVSSYIRDEIAAMRAEAARFRAHAKAARRTAATTRDPIERLKARSRVSEYVLAAQQRDARAKELRAQLPQRPRHRHDFSDGDVCNGCDMLRA